MQENEVGLLVGAVDLTITYLASWPLVGIRNRLQVNIHSPEITRASTSIVPKVRIELV